MVEVRPNDDDLIGASPQQANDVGQLRSLHPLFGKVLLVATDISKHLLERCLPLLVVTLVFPQAGFHDLAGDRVVTNAVGSRTRRRLQQREHDRGGMKEPRAKGPIQFQGWAKRTNGRSTQITVPPWV